jgi:hypothetical protein
VTGIVTFLNSTSPSPIPEKQPHATRSVCIENTCSPLSPPAQFFAWTVTDRTVDVYILRLRQRIENDAASPALIRSVRGFGYSFNENVAQENEEPTAVAG